MIKRIAVPIFLTILLILVFPIRFTKTSEYSGKTRFAKDHIIIKLKGEPSYRAAGGVSSNLDTKTLNDISADLKVKITQTKRLFPTDFHKNVELAERYQLSKFYLIYFENPIDIQELCKNYERYLAVDYAEPDFIGEGAGERTYGILAVVKPNDEFYNRQWALNNNGNTRTTIGRPGKSGADIDAERGWDIETGDETIIVGIMDSGSKLDHPDLAGRFWINKKETKNGKDNDQNGYVDDVYGWNFAYDNNNVTDDGGHGTNISGTIGAVSNNSIGYTGVDWKCKLMICKNLDDENLGEYSWWATSLYYAANNGARVINMSEGGYDYSKTLETAVNFAYDAGCFIVASMMNKNNNDTYYPAAYKNVFAVGATDTDDGRVKQFTWGGGSNWGKHIAVVAPGNRIYGLDYKDDYNYDVYWSGTSQATAYVSGIAALLLAQDPSRTNKDLRSIISATAKDQVGDPNEDAPGWDEYYGYGRVDLYDALTYGKTPVENREERVKNIDTSASVNPQNPVDRQAKAVDRNSSQKNIEENSNKEKPARKVEP